ncbi:energy transducer TonB [Myxococcaceae bacterium GXIMD 01537]
MKTILNFELESQGGGAAVAERLWPSANLFRMGAASTGDGEWTRWGWAAVIAVLVHGVALVLCLSAPPAPPKAAAPPEPELVFLAFAPPPAPAAAAPAAVQQRAHRPAPRPRPKPQELTVPAAVPEPVVKQETPPQPPEEPEVVEQPVDEAPTTAVAGVASAGSAEAVTGAVVGGVVGGREGGMLGATGDAVLEMKQVARPPSVLKQVAPRYPSRARSERIQGTVVVRFIIGTDGRVEPDSLRVIRGVVELDEAALDTVREWRFTPALGHHGRPVRVITEVPVQFSLK